MDKAKHVLAAGAYGIGTAVVGILIVIVASGWEMVLFPDAMLPMQISELASVWLAWGTLPMGIASVVFCKAFRISASGKGKWKMAGVFLPALICLCFLLYWILAWSSILALVVSAIPDSRRGMILPLQIAESASVWLAWGALPPGIASMILCKIFRICVS